MSKNILVFAASNSKESINQKLALHAANNIEGATLNVLDLNDLEMPIFSIDRENESGIPEQAHQFRKHILASDGIIISFAEHNSSFAVAYKNIFDWASRIEGNVWEDKPMLVMATSPGGGGGKRVLAHAVANYSHRNKNLVEGIALPSFYDNFKEDEGFEDAGISDAFNSSLSKFKELI